MTKKTNGVGDLLTVPCWPGLRRALEHEVAVNIIGSTPEEVATYLIIRGLDDRRRERGRHDAAIAARSAALSR